MLEDGNPAVFTQGVSSPRVVNTYDFHCLAHVTRTCFSVADSHRLDAGATVTEGHRSETQRHHEAGEEHQGAARHVHGHGHVG